MVAEAGVDEGEVLLAESESLGASVGAAAGYGATTADLPDLAKADVQPRIRGLKSRRSTDSSAPTALSHALTG